MKMKEARLHIWFQMIKPMMMMLMMMMKGNVAARHRMSLVARRSLTTPTTSSRRMFIEIFISVPVIICHVFHSSVPSSVCL